MRVQRIHPQSIPQKIQAIGTDSMGKKIMNKKAQMLSFEISGLSFEAVHILKQEALSAGGDCATPKETITHKGEHIALLIATRAQLEKIIAKLSMQPFGLKALKNILQQHLKTHSIAPSIMAIINATPDSFYEYSRVEGKNALKRIDTLLEKEVDIIDIGAASSRPGSELIESNEEIARLKPIAEYIATHKLYEKVCFSIDTYNPQTADYALSNGFKMINDVSGFSNGQMIQVAAQYNARVVLMHTKGIPKTMQSLTHNYTHLFNDIDCFFEHKIALLNDAGITDIILDVGFGFAKDTLQNLALIKDLAHFLHFGFPLLIGASRKNTIGEITGRDTQNRLSGTLALHLFALQNGASILRTHDEDEHIDMLKIYKAMQ
ncbi:dihydropteroate synthase [Helicobacter sp. MIT 21-1697]|uniref:dihydropteroate synthase n=1 Tax=Helicobacter sp. MIT 21-1697 TaxID=2993733 RepID=UPI00224B04C0|nr:dihydropteroate synthase [Helicobacter sp. MIT 21-1697]MCX2716243.1 dihydropteroate synthase [Helicobacter sp. MIT 21-1697]